ncbi:DEAD/DEAH box helicase [Aerococcus sp. UMB7834]|uniref:DEAD/DEAH box helicase n=1 Tax=Aerococcus sp. UMB7834 TaxID=3046342 RepID=UPI00254FB138|nr:DEAD/DEAH box helicase [Aerococcus sp. UMB7834]MDK6804909.1 DEAD/DEAH box helicase [Aerococcus sp. UMB7834]
MEEDLMDSLRGRLLTAEEVGLAPEQIEGLEGAQCLEAVNGQYGQLSCQRCHNQDQAAFYRNPCFQRENCYYCLSCLQFGKVSSCDKLYHLPRKLAAKPSEAEVCLAWQGQLSDQQAEGAQKIRQRFEEGKDCFIWAVTGAGKTEMLFPALQVAMANGKRLSLASPRLDVCNELYPRLQAAFPQLDIALLHGESDQSFRDCPLTICSTHQLIRFQAYFDGIIIDEVDAFPFVDDPTLHFAAERALVEGGVRIFLSATPSRRQEAAINKQEVAAFILPARYHRKALPVPHYVWIGDWRQSLSQAKLPRRLQHWIGSKLEAKRRFLLFLPHIPLMLALEEVLHRVFDQSRLASVSAKDPERTAKVQVMREDGYDFLLTTTILERGVTFPNIDVAVLGTEDPTFTQQALVQISGRVGRKADAATGEVVFFHQGKTRASQAAIRQIRGMNRLARERGLLDD